MAHKVRSLQQKTLSKDFHELNDFIAKHRKILNQDNAFKIVLNCCNICINNSETLHYNYLSGILKDMVMLISTLNETQILQYAQSMYYIIKYLSTKKLYNILIDIEDVIWPTFMVRSLSKKLQNTYSSIGQQLFNIIGFAVNEPHIIDTHCALKIHQLMIQILSHTKEPVDYFTKSVHSFVNLTKIQVPLDELKDRCVLILKKMSSKQINNVLDFYEPLSLLTFTMVHCLLKSHKFNLLERFLKETRLPINRVLQNHQCGQYLISVLQFPLLFLPVMAEGRTEKISKFNHMLKDFVDSDVNKHRKEFGGKLYILLISLVNFYKSKTDIWREFSEDVQLALLKCIYCVSELESDVESKCSCGCPTTINYYQSFSYCQVIITFLDISTSKGNNISVSTYKKFLALLSKFVDKIIYLYNNKCKYWKKAWASLGTGLYNIALYLYKQENVEVSLQYFFFFLKNALKFKDENEMSIKFSLISSALQAVCSLTLKDYNKCLAFAALGIFLCPKESGYFMSVWIKTKYDLKDKDSIQTLTLVEAFKKFSKELSIVIDCVDMIKEGDEIKLLTFELQQYKKKWQSKIPMSKIFKELTKRIKDPEILTELIGTAFGDMPLLFEEKILLMAETILSKVKRCVEYDNQETPKPFLGVLHFLHYKHMMIKAIKIQTKEVIENSKVVPLKLTVDPNQEPNDECDIVSSYEKLKLSQYLNDIKYLESSLAIIEGNILTLEVEDNGGIFDILKHIAFEYKLMGNKNECVRALTLALTLAQSGKTSNHVLDIVSLLIEYSDVNKEDTRDLIRTAEELINSNTNTLNVNTIRKYHISMAKAFLYENLEESYQHYTKACSLQSGDIMEDGSSKIGMFYLELKYLSMPCEHVGDLHKGKIFNIFCRIRNFFKEFAPVLADASSVALFLDTNEAVTKFYHYMKRPRDVLYFCKELVILTQKLILPLRCSSYLIYLSHADLFLDHFDDCRVKLNGIIDILNYNKNAEKSNQVKSKFELELESLTEQMDDISLDLPRNNIKKRASPSSPYFQRKNVHLPSFVHHEDACKCFCCNCTEYQELLLKNARLQALMNLKENDFQSASKMLCSGFSLYKLYCDRVIQNNNNVYDLLPRISKEYIESYGYLLLDFTNFFMSIDQSSPALATSEKLLKLINPHKSKCMQLYRETLLQKLSLSTQMPTIEVIDASPTRLESEEMVKTPTDNFTEVVVDIKKISPHSPLGRTRLKKRLQFETSPENPQSQLNLKQSSTSTITRNEGFSVKKERLKIAGSKIKIFTEDEDTLVTSSKITRSKSVIEKEKSSKKIELKPRNKTDQSSRQKLVSRKNLLEELKSEKSHK